jgi:hypothetical protein
MKAKCWNNIPPSGARHEKVLEKETVCLWLGSKRSCIYVEALQAPRSR